MPGEPARPLAADAAGWLDGFPRILGGFPSFEPLLWLKLIRHRSDSPCHWAARLSGRI